MDYINLIREVAFVTAIMSDLEEPLTFQEAWHHPHLQERAKWRAAIRKEFKDMINRGVWRLINQGQRP